MAAARLRRFLVMQQPFLFGILVVVFYIPRRVTDRLFLFGSEFTILRISPLIGNDFLSVVFSWTNKPLIDFTFSTRDFADLSPHHY